MSDNWHSGDHYLIDDRTGLKIRASDSVTQWDGLVVHRNDYEPRQPQDFVRGRPENMTVTKPRPRPIDTFIGPLDTELVAAAAAGAILLEVLSTIRMAVNDRLSIMLDNGATFLTTIAAINSASQIQINNPLSWAAASGQKIYDNTATALADVG